MGYLSRLRASKAGEWKFNGFFYGDSTTQGVSYDEQPNLSYPVDQRYGYPWKLRELIEEQTGYPCDEFPKRVGRGGTSIKLFRDTVDSDLLSRPGRADFCIVNIGKGDKFLPITDQTVIDYLYIVDSILFKYPGVKIYLCRPWQSSAPMANWNNIAHVCELVEQQRYPQVYAGTDERVFLENGDNGITYTVNGHPNHLGYMKTAQEILNCLNL